MISNSKAKSCMQLVCRVFFLNCCLIFMTRKVTNKFDRFIKQILKKKNWDKVLPYCNPSNQLKELLLVNVKPLQVTYIESKITQLISCLKILLINQVMFRETMIFISVY